MHESIEHYLAAVAAQLHPLPIARRDEELREMHHHLQNAVIVNRKMGQDEYEAAHTALEQFDPPEEWAGSVVGPGRGLSIFRPIPSQPCPRTRCSPPSPHVPPG